MTTWNKIFKTSIVILLLGELQFAPTVDPGCRAECMPESMQFKLLELYDAGGAA
jgi:hypothetical protein